jgi:protein SCO1/2
MKRVLPFLLPISLLVGLGWMYIQSGKPKKVFKELPVLGNHRIDSTITANGVKRDTVFHRIPKFSFIDQDSLMVTEQMVKGKVYVADYFFSTCKSICPIMSRQMERVQKARPELMILSFTVDPENDNPKRLKEYATEHGAVKGRWHFLTGSKPQLYELARKGFLLDAREGDGGAEDFIHTQNFALIDKGGRIRGYYDGTDSVEVTRLITDSGFLLQEKAK